MKDYKRLTERRYGSIIDNCANCPNVKNPQGCTAKKCYEIKKNRLAELEDKIERGELCDREEVRKETAREIVLRINQVRKTHLGHLRSEIDLICRKYGIELEDEE